MNKDEQDEQDEQDLAKFLAVRDQIMATFRDCKDDLERIMEVGPKKDDVKLIQLMCDFCLGELCMKSDWTMRDDHGKS